MRTRCKCCLSPQLDYINEMLEEGIGFSTITGRMKEVYGETISKDSLANHRDKHMAKGGSKNEPATKIAEPDKTTPQKKLIPSEEIAALKARVRALELITWQAASTVQYTGWDSYSIAGKTPHQLTYKNIVEECMEDKEDLGSQYKAFIAGIIKRRKVEDGEPLKDEFVEQRANLKAKNEEEAKIAAAEVEIREQMAAKQAAEDKITNLSEENIREMKKAKEDIKAREAKHEAEIAAIDEQAAIMEMEDEGE